jgi:RadC-like JAB domain
MFLDNRHRLIQFDEVFRGTIDGSSVYPREVVRRTLELNAAALVRRVRMRPLRPHPPLRTGLDGFRSSGSSRCKARR